MLFELAVAVAERQLIDATAVDWDASLSVACERQRVYYDAVLPQALTDLDKEIAATVAGNLVRILRTLGQKDAGQITVRPRIPGYQWISNSVGDFGTTRSLIEVKCIDRRFTTADYRQLTMYWILCYIDSLEHDTACWTRGFLANPRLNFNVEVEMSDLISIASTRRSVLEVVETFRAVVEDHRPPQSAL